MHRRAIGDICLLVHTAFDCAVFVLPTLPRPAQPAVDVVLVFHDIISRLAKTTHPRVIRTCVRNRAVILRMYAALRTSRRKLSLTCRVLPVATTHKRLKLDEQQQLLISTWKRCDHCKTIIGSSTEGPTPAGPGPSHSHCRSSPVERLFFWMTSPRPDPTQYSSESCLRIFTSKAIIL